MNPAPDTFDKFPVLREKYPEEIKTIEEDERKMDSILQTFAFYENPVMQSLLANCRRDVVMARTKLATDRSLKGDDAAQDELWKIIDARMWFIERAAQNYRGELDALNRELESALNR